MLAQRVEQRGAGVDLEGVLAAVDLQAHLRERRRRGRGRLRLRHLERAAGDGRRTGQEQLASGQVQIGMWAHRASLTSRSKPRAGDRPSWRARTPRRRENPPMATIVGGIAASHTPTIGFAFDATSATTQSWTPMFEAFDPVRRWLAQKPARRALLHLQRPRHVILLRPLLGVRARHRRALRGGRRGRRRARPAPVAGRSGVRRAPRPLAHGRRVRPVLLPGPGARPRLLLAAVDAVPARRRRLAGAESFRCRSACCSSRSRRRAAATGSARRCAARSRAIRKTCGSRSSRPAACRTRSTASAPASTTPPGTSAVPRPVSRTTPSGSAGMTHAELAELGGFEGAEVIMWLVMRGALSANVRCLHRAYYAAVDDRHRDRDLRRPRRRAVGERGRSACASTRSSSCKASSD